MAIVRKTKVKNLPKECKCHEMIFDSVKEGTLPPYRKIEISKSELYKSVWPILLYMRFFGLFFIRNPKNVKKSDTTGSVLLERASVFNCVLVAIMQWFPVPLCLVSMYAIKKMNMIFFTQILAALWVGHSALSGICCIEMCYNTKKFYTLCERWQSLIWCSAEKSQIEKSLRKRTVWILILVFIQNCYNVGAWVSRLHSGRHFPAEMYNTVSYKHFSNSVTVFSSMHFHLSVAWSVPLCLFAVVSMAITDILKHLRNEVQISKATNRHWKIQDSTHLFSRYQRIIYLIQSASDTFGPLLLNSFFVDMLRLCVNTFMFLFICANFEHKLQLFQCLAFRFIILSYLSKISADLNDEVRSTYTEIAGVQNAPRGTTGQLIQLNKQFNSMTQRQVGMSLCGFTILTRATLGSIVSTYVSFFFVIAQWQKPIPCEVIGNGTYYM